MFQVDEPTASPTLPTPAAVGTQGFFTNGNPANGVAATILDADWLNMVQTELLNVVLAAGETPSKTTYTQVRDAIKRLSQSQQIIADTGAANAYAAANASPLTALPATGFIQCVSIAHANTGASTYAPDGLATKPILGLGLQPLQGGELVVNGIATMMYVVAATINSGNGAWILFECTGGSLQIPPATTSNQAVQFSQVSGVVGQARNLVMSVAAASATATMTADEIIVETALGGLRYCLASFSKTINLGITGAGGMDAGSAPAGGYVALYAIWNPTTSTAALLAQNASGLAGSTYSGAFMPAGYTASALVSVWPTNGSGQFVIGVQQDRDIGVVSAVAVTTSSTSASTTVGLGSIVPRNAKTVSGTLGISFNATSGLGSLSMSVYDGSVPGAVRQQQVAYSNAVSGLSGVAGTFSKTKLTTAQILAYSTSISGTASGTPSYTVNINGYSF